MTFIEPTKENINGLILAGGRSRRFNNQDKALMPFNGTTLVEHAVDRLKKQTHSVLVSANRHFDFYQQRNINYIEDKIADYAGPLAGIHAALATNKTPWLVSIACDTPCFPKDYVSQLANAVISNNTLIAVARSQNRLQNISMLIHQSLFDSLDCYLKAGERKAQIWLEQLQPSIVDFNQPEDSFFNINTEEQLQQMEHRNCDE